MHGCISRRWRLMATCFSFSGAGTNGILRGRRQASDDMTVKACAPSPIRSCSDLCHLQTPFGWSIRSTGGKRSLSSVRCARLLAVRPKFLLFLMPSLGVIPRMTLVPNWSCLVAPIKLRRWRRQRSLASMLIYDQFKSLAYWTGALT